MAVGVGIEPSEVLAQPDGFQDRLSTLDGTYRIFNKWWEVRESNSSFQVHNLTCYGFRLRYTNNPT